MREYAALRVMCMGQFRGVQSDERELRDRPESDAISLRTVDGCQSHNALRYACPDSECRIQSAGAVGMDNVPNQRISRSSAAAADCAEVFSIEV